MITRRLFSLGLAAGLCAPAIVRVASIMPVRRVLPLPVYDKDGNEFEGWVTHMHNVTFYAFNEEAAPFVYRTRFPEAWQAVADDIWGANQWLEGNWTTRMGLLDA